MSKLVFKNYSRESYQQHFDAKAYAENHTGKKNYSFRTTYETFLHKYFKEGILTGKTMLDFGCGPTLKSAIPASAHVPEIYLGDLVEQNRNEIKKWLQKTSDAHDLSWEFEYVAGLEMKDARELEERVRKSIVDIIPCDFLLTNPLHPKKMTFDVITTCLCLDCVSDVEDYYCGMKNISSLIKPGGKLAQFGIFGGKSYFVKNVEFPSNPLTEQQIKESVKEAGMELIEYHAQYWRTSENFSTFFEGTFFAISKKL